MIEYSSTGVVWTPATTYDSLVAAREAVRSLDGEPPLLWRIVRLRGAQREIVSQ